MNVRTSLFQNIRYLVNLPRSTYCQSPKGIKYKGFTYFPRHENFKDEPYEPSKLFLVKRIKSMRKRNPLERECLGLLNIDGNERNNAHMNVVKNIPSTNAILWKVKHLIEIKPITWKGDLPEDFLGTHLRDTGELIISPELKVTLEQLEASKEALTYDKKPDRVYLKEYLKNKWWNGFTGSV